MLFFTWDTCLARKRTALEVRGDRRTAFTLIFLESPHRLLDSLADLQSVLGDRSCAVARELTKLHEEIFRGKISEAIAHFTAQPARGEFTLVIDGNYAPDRRRWSEAQLRAAMQERRERGESPSELAKRLASESGWNAEKFTG